MLKIGHTSFTEFRWSEAYHVAVKKAAFQVEDIATFVFVNVGSIHIEQFDLDQMLNSGGIAAYFPSLPHKVTCAQGATAILWEVPFWWAVREPLKGVQIRHISAEYVTTSAIFAMIRAIMSSDPSSFEHDNVLTMLAALLRRSFTEPRRNAICTKVTSNSRFARILTFIAQHLADESLAPGDAALSLRCSVRTIHKECADAGTSFSKLLLDSRLAWARYRLVTGSERISDLAYSSGFISLSHFCRTFRNQYGVAANQYRASYLPAVVERDTGTSA